MAEYLATGECLMKFLAGELGDDAQSNCGKCESCLGRALVPADYPMELAGRAASFLRGRPYPIEPRKRGEGREPSP